MATGFIDRFLQVFVGSRNERIIRTLKAECARINALEPQFTSLSNEQLRDKTTEFKHRIEKGEALDSILHEAFAAVREASKRALGQRHYDVQMIGGMVLHRGSIAEMVTGEGKTLTATGPIYLNALAGRGVHVITVNDYLARRDAEWMGNVFRMLGLTCGFIQSSMDNRERRQMYACDVTYGTNNEFGFDYLRDNMKTDPQDQVQRGLYYAIVDEVDSILIDEARTPLIISGPTEDFSQYYAQADKVARSLEGIHDRTLKEKIGKDAMQREVYLKALQDYDFEIREKESQCLLTDKGIEKVERALGVGHLYDARNQMWPHMIEQALRAHHLFKLDKNYVVQAGEEGKQEVIIVDEFTGRLQHGRRWSDGLHQAVEAKESIKVREESATYATVTLQNYFKLYNKLAGMTGTALTEAGEFDTIYNLDVVAIPTNNALIRDDRDDLIYGSEGEKFIAAVGEVIKLNLAGRPILLGTTSVLKSERLSDLLRRVSVRYSGGKLSIRTPVFHLPAPGTGKKAATGVPDVKVEPAVREFDCMREYEGRLQVRLPAPSVRTVNVKADPKIETWFDVRPELAKKLKEPAGFIGVEHNVLNAKLHAQEAEIVAQAGSIGAVTIATNMAGRGTDIILGGNGEFVAKQWLKREKGMDLAALLPEEHRESPAYLIPRDVLIKAEKDYDELVKKTYAEKFKPDFVRAHDAVVKLGGLAVVGTERHESRRIDNQLRGRCGRQGDPGSSQFFISLDDDLMRLFAGPRIRAMMQGLGLKDGEAIQARMITKSVARAQRKVEGHHFDMRKNLKEYDDVLDLQRKTIYRLRQSYLEGVDREQGAEIDAKIRMWMNDLMGMRETVTEADASAITAYMKKEYGVTLEAQRMVDQRRVLVRDVVIRGAKFSKMPQSILKAVENRIFNVCNRLMVEATPDPENSATWDLENFAAQIAHVFGTELKLADIPRDTAAQLNAFVEDFSKRTYERLTEQVTKTPTGEKNPDRLVHIGRYFLLTSIDTKWREHLRNMEQLRYGIHWEAQAQKDPKIVYKREGLAMFERLLDDVDTEVTRNLFHVKVEESAPQIAPAARPSALTSTSSVIASARRASEAAAERKAHAHQQAASAPAKQETAVRKGNAPGPNDPCWCGSGKKYKKCHLTSDKATV
ncbi:MAG: preprotein translocase subunit SecA [Planctomycetes bacterium]|nr:preprotein translocase subunit SecA [Planctomycetota bacterium]